MYRVELTTLTVTVCTGVMGYSAFKCLDFDISETAIVLKPDAPAVMQTHYHLIALCYIGLLSNEEIAPTLCARICFRLSVKLPFAENV